MTPLFLAGEVTAWRLDLMEFADTWDSGEGARQLGGRWNSIGLRAIYCSIDPATAILEVAAHRGFRALDTVPHVLTSLTITDPSNIRVIRPADVPNANWLRPGTPSAGQQEFGDTLLARHKLVAIPSAISSHSWNLIVSIPLAAGAYLPRSQEPFALDTRLHPPRPQTGA